MKILTFLGALLFSSTTYAMSDYLCDTTGGVQLEYHEDTYELIVAVALGDTKDWRIIIRDEKAAVVGFDHWNTDCDTTGENLDCDGDWEFSKKGDNYKAHIRIGVSGPTRNDYIMELDTLGTCEVI